MNKTSKIIITIILISSILIGGVFYIDSIQKQEEEIETEVEEEKKEFQPRAIDTITHEEETEVVEEESKEKEEVKTDELILDLKQAAWIPPWDYNNGVNSLKNFDSDFHSVSPVTFQINRDGSLTERLDPNLSSLREVTERKGILLVPTISNFDSNMMKNIFDSEENTRRHIDAITGVVREYNYDGIDLDYESISRGNKEDFLNFIAQLSKELSKESKILSVTVLPKWGEGVTYTSSAETRYVQDWEIISKWADEVRIMAYDFTHISDSNAGPIAPIDWVTRILEYAQETIPPEKTWLGIHLYSYEWAIPQDESKPVRTNSYTYNVVKESILNHDYVQEEYNEKYEEGFAQYSCLENYTCKLYYATPESVRLRKSYAKEFNVQGVTYWRLGGEGELIR